jgi:formate-dependent nitrite reductase cytochrome c552 subunit
MMRDKNPDRCRHCKDELPFGHFRSTCNFCHNQKKATVATKRAKYDVERHRRLVSKAPGK